MTDRITSIIPHVIPADPEPHPWWSHKPYVLVRVETEDGIIGWGECHTLTFREEAIASMVRTVAEQLVGQPAGDVRKLLPMAFNSFGQQRPGLEVYCAFAGVEIALWDILGKRLNAPVYKLLGGACRDTIPVYANIYSPTPQTPDALAEIAAQQVAAGHHTIKLYPFLNGTSISDGVTALAAVKDAVGPGVGLAIDLWRHATPSQALDIARAVEPFDLVWIEDPFAPTDAKAMRQLRDQMQQPLLTGETLPSRREFVDLVEQRAVDIINPDICLSGILELQAIAALVEPAFISVSPHNSNSMALGSAAGVHASFGITNLASLETFPLFEEKLDRLCEGRLPIVQGHIAPPDAPGIGIRFDEAAMATFRF